jgi:chromosome segregation ATPase
LSLGEAIESPFRAMDEFDVFMDAVNRKVSMDNLIEFARDDLNAEKQFLFITPQDISAVDAADADIKVQRMKAARPS